MRADEFLNIMEPKDKGKTISLRYGYVDPDYSTGNPGIIFDGMDNPSIKKYPHLSSYNPVANDRVAVINNLILGAIKTY